MTDLSKHIQEGARLELEALERSTDECSFLSAQNSYQEMKIDELKRDLAAANARAEKAESALRECITLAQNLADLTAFDEHKYAALAYRQWRANHDK